MLQAFWDFLTSNKDPIDTLVKFLTFLGLPISALITVIATIIRRWWRNRLRLEINAFDFILNVDALLPRVYNEDNNLSPLSHHQIEYQPRDHNRDIQSELHGILRTSSRYLLIEGRTGLGKTREAATLVKSLMNEGYRVIRITTAWLDVPKEFPKELNNDRRRILLLLDDLNGLFRSGDFIQSPKAEQILVPSHDSYHDRLLRTLDAFEQICGKDEILVVATARNEANEWSTLRFDDRDALWSRFLRFQLPEPVDDSLIKLIDNFATKVDLQVERRELSLIARENDGTYMNVVLNLQRLKKENKALSLASYTPTLDGSWREVYERSIQAQSAVRYIYDAIDLLDQIGIDLYIWMVESIALLLWGGNLIEQIYHSYKIKQAVKFLLYDEKIIAENNNEIAPRDGQIEAKGAQVNWEPLASDLYKLVSRLSEQKPEELIKSLSGFARALIEKGFTEEAVLLMKKRVELSPRNSQLWIDLDSTLESLERYEEAEKALQKAIAYQPEDEHIYFHLGLLLTKTKRYEKAIEAYRQAIVLEPAYHVYVNLGAILQKLNRNAEAEEMFQNAVSLRPKDSEAHVRIGSLLHESKRYAQAEEYLNKALTLDEKFADAWAIRGILLFDTEQYDEALANLERAVALAGNKAWIIANRAELYFRLEELDKAFADINRALTLDDKDARLLATRGKIFRELGNYEKSLEDLDKAITFDPQNDIALAERGETYLQLEKYDKALSDFESAIKLDPNFHWAYERKGIVFQRLNQLWDAIESLTQAENITPTCYICVEKRGEIYLQIGEIESAIRDFDRAISLKPEFIIGFIRRGDAYRQLGKLELAVDDLNRAISLDDENPSSFKTRGDLHWEMDALEKALADYDQAITLNPNFHPVYESRAMVLRSLNRYQDAIESLFNADDEDSPCANCLAHRGEIYRRLGDPQRALVNLNRAMDFESKDQSYERSRRAAIYHNLGDINSRDADAQYVLGLPHESTANLYNKAVISVIINEYDDAINWLSKAVEKDRVARVYAKYDDLFDPLTIRVEFRELLRG
jgi:tetratricopeptide (TPR) repeat protein